MNSCTMEGIPLCNGGFRNLSLQELQNWGSGRPNSVCGRGGLEIAKKRAHVPQAGYDNSRGNGLKDIYRRRDSERSGERRLQTSRDGEMGRRGITGISGVVELASHVDTITSVQNPYVKHLVKLRQNTSYRNAAGCVLVVGSVPLR